MERDFMGLKSKEPVVPVKEDDRDSGYNKGAGIQWSFPNKVSALPQLMSFKVNQEDKNKKIVSAPTMSMGFMPFSSAESFDPAKRGSTGENQKHLNLNLNQQGGPHISMTAFPMQQDLTAHNNIDVKMFPVSNQTISKGNTFLKNNFASAGQNLADGTRKQHLFGVPVTAPHLILPTMGSFTGICEPSAKAYGLHAQLTIFYAGQVNVFDDVSPEKLQAIMSLACNGSSAASNSIHHPKEQLDEPISKHKAGDRVPVNHSHTTPPRSSHSSPLSVTSHTSVQSRSGSTNSDELFAAKNSGVEANHVNQVDSTKVLNAMGAVATTMIPSAVPQARKASLARFLEKRKERVTTASPYNFNKKSIEYATRESNQSNSAHLLGSS